MEILENSYNSEQNIDFYEFHKNAKNSLYYYRSKIIILNHEGMDSEHIAKRVGVSKETVKRWIVKYNKEGIKGLTGNLKR